MKKLTGSCRGIALLALACAGLVQLSGCSTLTAVAESALTKPSLSETVDAFESAALAIRTSNRVLLQAPISEEELWPDKLYAMPSAENSLKMAISGTGSYFGVTVPTEFDPETGLPRPTSPLYLMIRDRNQMLDRELKKAYLDYFRDNPEANTCAIVDKKPDCVNEFAYRNTLRAYGTVLNNSAELAGLEQKMELTASGFKECDAWVRRSREGDVARAYCKDPALKSGSLEKEMQAGELGKELATMKKNYGRLSRRIYLASVSGADFTAAAITKLTAAIIKFPDAWKNRYDEFRGWRGASNAAMVLPRIKNLFSALGVYKDNLAIQLTAYKTMYTEIKGNYEVEDTPRTKEALLRLEEFEREFAAIRPRLELLAAGRDAEFSRDELAVWERLAAAYPPFDQAILTAWNDL